jgi:transcriptional regulator with XRE-family HTH domain
MDAWWNRMARERSDELTGKEAECAARAVREEMARRRITRQYLADLAKISLSTLEKSLSGQRGFSLATIVRIEEALGVRLRGVEPPHPMTEAAAALVRTAPPELGAYARRSVTWLEGAYQTLRPSLSNPGAIYAYKTIIAWDEQAGCLAFSESERQDASYRQQGVVSLSHLSGHVYLITKSEGQFRLVIASRPAANGAMYGLIASLAAGKGAHLMPFSAPIAFLPIREGEAIFGLIAKGEDRHPALKLHLDRVLEEGFAQFPGGAVPA